MSITSYSRVAAIFFNLLLLLDVICVQYSVPDVDIEVFTPRGFRVSVPDAVDSRIVSMKFAASVFRRNVEIAQINGVVSSPKNRRWVLEDARVVLQTGDVIVYNMFVDAQGSQGFNINRRSYTVTKLKEPEWYEPQFRDPIEDDSSSTSGPSDAQQTTKKPQTMCRPSPTKVRGGSACAGQTIFEDNFDNWRDDLWQIEQYIPDRHPDHPFVSYQHYQADPTVKVRNGQLVITPKLQDTQPDFANESIYTGTLNLFAGCTKAEEECTYTAMGASIVPPVVSGRVTSRFAFTYGTIEVRAWLPTGDWLYPEIILEPFLKKYGVSNYASGILQVAMARGNKNLQFNNEDIGNSRLETGAVLSTHCKDEFLYHFQRPHSRWGDGFHTYSLTWTPDSLRMSVDNIVIRRVDIGRFRLRDSIPLYCRSSTAYDILDEGDKMAPFDDHFFIALGVNVGGTSQFPDISTKPWMNSARKAMLDFWNDKERWYPTWSDAALSIDYVRVIALDPDHDM